MSRYRLALLAALCCWIACERAATHPWSQGIPVNIRVDAHGALDEATIRKAATDRFLQFGFTFSANGRPLTVSYDAECACPNCKLPPGGSIDGVLAYTPEDEYDHIRLCPGVIKLQAISPNATYVSTSHEMCHALGLETHIPAGAGVLCSADHQLRKDVMQFGVEDMRAICQAGGIQSTVCKRLSP